MDASKPKPVAGYGIKVFIGFQVMAQIAMTIGELARAACVHVETIRYYQRLGLLPVPAKPYAGQRRYGEAELNRLRFIKRAQSLGFSLEEVRLLLDLARREPCSETKRIARQKLAAVEEKLADLNAMRTTLLELVNACDLGGSSDSCPIIECLDGRRY